MSLMTSPAVVVPEQPAPGHRSWRERYGALAAGIRIALGSAWLTEHVGATSVPGLPARPVVDLALRVPAGRTLDDALPALERAGWTGPTDVGDHRALFRVEDGVQVSIAHVFTAAQWPDAHLRLFAAWLRDHADDRAAYARLKQELLEGGVRGAAYTRVTTAFVQDVVNRARAARGLLPVDLTGGALRDLDEGRRDLAG